MVSYNMMTAYWHALVFCVSHMHGLGLAVDDYDIGLAQAAFTQAAKFGSFFTNWSLENQISSEKPLM
jgi:hypothetical protein